LLKEFAPFFSERSWAGAQVGGWRDLLRGSERVIAVLAGMGVVA